MVLTRKAGERIRLLPEGWAEEDAIWVTMVETRARNVARIDVDAPDDVRVDREEVAEARARGERR